MVLSNSNDFVYLKDSKNRYIDVIAYGMNAPDGSSALEPADSGNSLQRVELHIDTNTNIDFKTSIPNPKADVPQEPLLTGDEKVTPFPGSEFLFSFIILVISRGLIQKRKKH
jgi:hypothetical protein